MNDACTAKTAQDRAEPAGFCVKRGTCYVFFAFEVGLAIDLDEAQKRISERARRASIRQRRRLPEYFEYEPAPLHVSQTVKPIQVGDHVTHDLVHAVIYDFGAISISYSIPLQGCGAELLDISDELWDNHDMLSAARGVAMELLRAISPTVAKQGLAEFVEDYLIYQIDELAEPGNPSEVLKANAELIAQVLRAERRPLSKQEISDATGSQIAFTRDDLAIIDWNAALLLDPEADDVRSVLEFANVELLELRYLDHQLDKALDESYQAMSRRSTRRYAMFGTKRADLWRIAEMRIDSALLYEGVKNALKLIGDQYLARVHRLVLRRFHLEDWNASIQRKLETIESIYEKIADRQATWRMEILEWIIIILIAVSIAMPFIPGVNY